MKLLSFNCRGLESKPKKLALKWLLSLLLQETMGVEEEISHLLKYSFPNYDCHAVSARVHSGGLVLAWKMKTIKLLNIWDFDSGIGVEFYHADLNLFFMTINIYGPYIKRESYWNRLKLKSFLKNENLILGGYLHFTLGNSEFWGPKARIDPLSNFFENLLKDQLLVDVHPTKINHLE